MFVPLRNKEGKFGLAQQRQNLIMATIELVQHNERADTWILFWVERQESLGRVLAVAGGSCTVSTQGPHWNPMKSFAGNRFGTPQDALREVQIYFEHR